MTVDKIPRDKCRTMAIAVKKELSTAVATVTEIQGPCRGGQLGNLVHTFDFRYEHTHCRRQNTMHFEPFKGLLFHKFPGGTCPRTLLA